MGSWGERQYQLRATALQDESAAPDVKFFVTLQDLPGNYATVGRRYPQMHRGIGVRSRTGFQRASVEQSFIDVHASHPRGFNV
jgi:hypothetical protein